LGSPNRDDVGTDWDEVGTDWDDGGGGRWQEIAEIAAIAVIALIARNRRTIHQTSRVKEARLRMGQMNADKRRSAFICVHLRLHIPFHNPSSCV